MAKRSKTAHQSNHYKATHHSGGKANKKSGGKGGKGNKSINKFLGIGQPGPHLLRHKRLLEAQRGQRRQQQTGPRQSTPREPQKVNNKKKKRWMKRTAEEAAIEDFGPLDPVAHGGTSPSSDDTDEYERDLHYQYDPELWSERPPLNKKGSDSKSHQQTKMAKNRAHTYGMITEQATAQADLLKDGADFVRISSPNQKSTKRKRDNRADNAMEMAPGCPWMGDRSYSSMPSVAVMLTQELQDFYDFLCPTQEEHQVRLYVYQRIKTIIQKLWPGADVAIFGSFETRLYLPSSDLDIVVRRQEPFTLMDLMKLKTHLQRTRAGIDVTCISHAKVPIVKFKDSVTRIPIDVSFNAHDGIRGASVVNNYLAQIPALRPLTMLVKHFMMVKDVNEVFKGGIGSYGTLMMILSFLQIHPKVQEGVIDPLQNLGVLLIEFFELYGRHFNYHDVGLSVADCGRYIQKTPGRDPSRLTALDPLDPNNDVTKASRRLPEVRQHFLAAFESLTRNLKERHRELFVGEREHTGEVSLIKDVLSVPLAVMKLRHHVETVFYQGLFQAMFDP